MLEFEKMQGLGNDFVIFDARAQKINFSSEQAQKIADRKTGIGCDQLIVLRHSKLAEIYMQIYNADGSEVSACGNATRCVASLMIKELKQPHIRIETKAGILQCSQIDSQTISVNMGIPKLSWENIPLSESCDTLHLPLESGELKDGVAVNIGNPHAVYFVAETNNIPLAKLGAPLEIDPFFPRRANINVAQIIDRQHIKLRVWERGVGETLACGTGACATMVAARRRGLIDDSAIISQAGGDLKIEWAGSETDPKQELWMTGDAAHVFSGKIDIL